VEGGGRIPGGRGVVAAGTGIVYRGRVMGESPYGTPALNMSCCGVVFPKCTDDFPGFEKLGLCDVCTT
jgi:hypothetical protein